jgi:hypothetical protein
LAQTFKAGISGSLTSVKLKLLQFGTVGGGNVWAEIYATDGTTPTTLITDATSSTLVASTVSKTTVTEYTFTFATPPTISAGTTYAIVFGGDYTNSDTNGILLYHDDNKGYADGNYWGNNPWVDWNADVYFKTYIAPISQYGVDTTNKVVYSNIADFSTFGVFGEELPPVYSAPTDSFTSGLTFNGSVDGNLSGGNSYTTNQNVTFLDTGSGRKYFMTAANFSGGNVNVSSLKIEALGNKIVVNATGVTGIYGTHTLWLPKTSDSGVYVCPNALTVSEVSSSCSNVLSFAGPFPQTKSDVTVSVDDSYWKVEGLTGSGAGEKGPIQSGNLSATVLETAVITMVVDTINFGSINVNQTLNATTAFGSGFQIDNDGNADINITISATALWTRSPYTSTSDKYRFACTTFNGTSCPTGSQTSWTNITIGGDTLVTADLPSASRTGVDIEITAPTDEPAGTRSSTVTLSASLA